MITEAMIKAAYPNFRPYDPEKRTMQPIILWSLYTITTEEKRSLNQAGILRTSNPSCTCSCIWKGLRKTGSRITKEEINDKDYNTF